jgi:GcrA cell cycle regulator
MRMLTQGNVALKMRAETIPEPRRIPLEEIVVPIALRASILTLTDTTCKWPIGEPGTDDFHFCGHSPRGGSPYCEYHSRVAYQTVDRRQRRAAG